MKKEDEWNISDNSFGIAAVVFGILSIVFSITILIGIILGVLSFVFAMIQRQRRKTKWATSAIVLSIIGVILSILVFAAIASLVTYIHQIIEACKVNPSLPGCEKISSLIQEQTIYG